MPRQSNGTYQPPGSTAAVSDQVISSTAYNTLQTDQGNEITNSLDRLGRAPMEANLPMGGYKITGMAAGVAATDAVNVQQIGQTYWIPPTVYGAAGDGVTNDYTALVVADNAILAAGKTMLISQPYAIGTSYTFLSPVKFVKGGSFVPAASVLISFGAGFEAPLHASIFNFSASGSGLATAQVIADRLTPQQFGVVENSPSSAVANQIGMQNWLNAATASGLDLYLPPGTIDITGQNTFDYGGGWGQGLNIYGTGTSSILNYTAGGASPCLNITDLTGYVSGTQRPEFYGEHKNFQIYGAPIGTNNAVLQYGSQTLNSDGSSQVYFNGLQLQNIVVKNNNTPGSSDSSVALWLSGLANCNLRGITANCGGWTAIGHSVAMMLQNVAFTNASGSTGNAAVGIEVNGQTDVFANNFTGWDFEVLRIAISNASTQFSNNYFAGTFSGAPASGSPMDIVVSSTAGSGNVIGPSQFGGVLSTFGNPTGGFGLFDGYGFTFRNANANWLGAQYPFGPTTGAGSLPVPATLTSGVWYQNYWGQDAFVQIFSANTDLQVFVRDYYDGTSAGTRVLIGNALGGSTIVKAGQSIQATSAGAITAVWLPLT